MFIGGCPPLANRYALCNSPPDARSAPFATLTSTTQSGLVRVEMRWAVEVDC